jgi:hypothetical protein
MEHIDISKTSALFKEVTGCLSYCCFNAVRETATHTLRYTVTLLLLLLPPTATDLPEKKQSSDQQVSKVSLLTDQFHFVHPVKRHVFFGN